MFNIENRRYIGCKKKMLKEIKKELLLDNYYSFVDLFGGTGVVTASVLDKFQEIHINDLLFSNEVIYDAFFGKGKFSLKKIEEIHKQISAKESYDTTFSQIYADTYFTKKDAMKIGTIREEIEKSIQLNKREKNILIASLIYSADRVSQTVGHYEAFFKKHINKKFVFELINPFENVVNIHRMDANDLVKNVTADVFYIDPPYNSRQYSRFYHVLETITLWNDFKVYGVALKPKPQNMSNYCRVSATKTFADLIDNIKAKKIVVSYNNTYSPNSKSSMNKISYEAMTEILSQKGKLEIREVSHKFFNTGKTNFKDHVEYIFVVEVEND